MFERAKDGVIFVSFGTFANTATMPYDIKRALIKVFATFSSYEFIWKFKPNEEDQILFKSSRNLHMLDWVNQTAILGKTALHIFPDIISNYKNTDKGKRSNRSLETK